MRFCRYGYHLWPSGLWVWRCIWNWKLTTRVGCNTVLLACRTPQILPCYTGFWKCRAYVISSSTLLASSIRKGAKYRWHNRFIFRDPFSAMICPIDEKALLVILSGMTSRLLKSFWEVVLKDAVLTSLGLHAYVRQSLVIPSKQGKGGAVIWLPKPSFPALQATVTLLQQLMNKKTPVSMADGSHGSFFAEFNRYWHGW